MKNLLKWIKRHKTLSIIVFIILFAVPLFVVHILYKIDIRVPWLSAVISAGEIIAYIAAFEAFVGTVLLGALTLWQNERFKDENDKSQQYLQKLSEQQTETLNRILWADKAKSIPLVDFSQSQKGDRYVNLELYYLESGEWSIKLFMKNVTEYIIGDVYISDLKLFTYNKKCVATEDSEHCYNLRRGLPSGYSTHFAFRLTECKCSDKNEYFEGCCPGHMEGNTKQQDTEQWATDRHFMIEVSFILQNVYGQKIVETLICHFNRDNDDKELFLLFNKEMHFHVLEEENNA